MTPFNIAIVLGPTLLWSESASSISEQNNIERVISIVTTLIEHYKTIFVDDLDFSPFEDEDLKQVNFRWSTYRKLSKLVLIVVAYIQSCWQNDSNFFKAYLDVFFLNTEQKNITIRQWDTNLNRPFDFRAQVDSSTLKIMDLDVFPTLYR